MSKFQEFILELASCSAPYTDIRIEQDAPTAVRMPDGWMMLEDVPGMEKIFPPDADELGTFLKNVDPDWEELIKAKAINRPIDLGNWRLRINAYLASSKPMLSIRRIPVNPPTINELGLPTLMRLMLEAPRGLILIGGATRSGKSTTAAAMLSEINTMRKAHVITIEDPIEYVFKTNKSIFSQREVRVDTPSFALGLEDAMRQCPDVIMVGEIRNRETAETAIQAGESGHLVIGTLHANSGPGVLSKILSYFPDSERAAKVQALSDTLVGVVHQILLPREDHTWYALATEIINNLQLDYSQAIGDSAKTANLVEQLTGKGSLSMANSLAELVKNKTVSPVDAMRATQGSPKVQEKIRQLLAASR